MRRRRRTWSRRRRVVTALALVVVLLLSAYPISLWLAYAGEPSAEARTRNHDALWLGHAWLDGRDFVTPDDVQAVAHDCLRHRVALSYAASADGVRVDDALDAILKQVAVAA